MNRNSTMKRTLLLAALTVGAPGTVRADERFFTYVYESEVLPKGRWEFEQWLTYRKGFPDGDRNFSQHIWISARRSNTASPTGCPWPGI